jgi:C4-dicarboxylate transporter DctQ subunit
MKFLKTFIRALSFVERSLVVAILTLMVVLAFIQVVLRNVFHTSFFWADPFLRHMVLWVGFLGASIATQQEKHINIDLITRYTSARVTNIIRIATNLFASAVCAYLAQAGWTFLLSEMESEGALLTIGSMAFQTWWFQIIIPAGFGLMALKFFIRTVEHVIESIRPQPMKPHETNVPVIEI